MREFHIKFISNAMTARWFRIMNIIETDQTFTIVKLSNALEVSQRTLITDIGSLKNHFGKSVCFIYENNRFEFKVLDQLNYQKKKKELLTNEIMFDLVQNIFYGDEEHLSDLAHCYNYSESTLRKILLRAQENLSEYGIELATNPVRLIGEEEIIRKFFFDFFYEGYNIPNIVRPPTDLHKLFLEEQLDQLKSLNLGTGSTITAYYYALYITIERIKQGHTVTFPRQLKELKFIKNEFEMLYSLRKKIEKLYNLQITIDDFCWVHYQVICKRPLVQKCKEEIFVKEFNLWPILEDIVDDYLIYCRVNSDNMTKMRPFLTSFILSKKINNEISPVLNKLMEEEKDLIIQNYPKEYNKNLHFFRHIKTKIDVSNQFMTDVAISLTLYSHVLFQKYAQPKKVLFLLEGDNFILQYIKSQAEQIIGNRHEVIFPSLKQFTESYLYNANVDLLVTNYEPYLTDYETIIDSLLLRRIPDRKDWELVLEKVNSFVF